MSGILKGIKTILGDVEMTPYTVITDNQTYEERLYPARKWVCTSVQSHDREAEASSMFRILFKYISGQNEPNIRIDMTTPVTTFYEPAPAPPTEGEGGDAPLPPPKHTMGFLVPEEHQKAAPDPADPNILIEERPEMVVLTRQFGGFASDTVVAREVHELSCLLKAAGEEGVEYSRYYVVGYDPPYKLINRRNEIWFVKTKTTSGDKGGEKGEEDEE